MSSFLKHSFKLSAGAEVEQIMSSYQNGDDAFELLLHQVTDDLVVEILDRLPLQTHKAS